MHISPDGWADTANQSWHSPNADARTEPPSLVVIHNISLPPNEFGGEGVAQLFTNTLNPAEHPYYAEIAHLRVSAHFFIRRTGELVQFVATEARAWHAGVSCWRGRERCNEVSLGIELEGCDTLPFTAGQYATLGELVAALKTRYPALQEMAGHEHIAPGRKTDPGACFDWPQAEALCGLPVWRGEGG